MARNVPEMGEIYVQEWSKKGANDILVYDKNYPTFLITSAMSMVSRFLTRCCTVSCIKYFASWHRNHSECDTLSLRMSSQYDAKLASLAHSSSD